MAGTVLILGATSDMGVAIAREFAAHGYHIQLAARRPQELEPLVSDLAIRNNIQVSLHSFEATAFATHKEFWEGLSPRPNIVIYVIGYMTDNMQATENWDESLRTIEANYTGAVSILNLAAKEFATRKAGTIVGISSVAGLRGRQSNFIYGSAKAGFTAYLSGLRNSLYHQKVHVMTVLPGFVYTKMTRDLSLPAMLTAQPAEVGLAVFKGVSKKADVIYVRWFWRYIMLVITSIPETIFKKRKL